MKLQNFTFQLPTRIEFGAGIVGTVGKEVKGFGGTKVLIITDKGIQAAGLLEPILAALKEENVPVEIFDKIVPNPRDVDCDAGAAFAKEAGADVLVAVGGGSVMDTAKAIATVMTHGGKTKDWFAPNVLEKPIAPLICIPTTCGTGSEVTYDAVITDTEKHVKENIWDPKCAAKLALVDPEMLLKLPSKLIASTGVDALIHCLEAYTCKSASPITDVIALYGISLVAENLVKAVETHDIDALSNMMLASLMGGIAFGNSDVAGIHCMAEALGGLYDIPHGIANAILLTTVSEFNIPANEKKYAQVARALGVNVEGISDAEAAKRGIEMMEKLCKDVGIPSMREIEKINPADFEKLAEAAANNVSAGSNPREAGKKEYLELFQRAYDKE